MRIVYYDGLCGLCDRLVQFLLPRDRRGRYHFAPLQGTSARDRLGDRLDPAGSDTFILEEAGTLRVRSDAALAVLTGLGGWWRGFAVFRVVPRPLRDAIYDLIARNRQRWWGRREACRVPEPHQRERFLP